MKKKIRSIAHSFRGFPEFYSKHKLFIFIAIIAIIILSLAVQLYMFYSEQMTEQDFSFSSIGWSEYCDGRNYTLEEKIDFCTKCAEKTGKCDWPLDMNLVFKDIGVIRATGGEVHCFFIIDALDYYVEKGSYYGITNRTLFTWQLLDASKPHDIQFCCGLDRESSLPKILNLKKDMKQACIRQAVQPRCIAGDLR